ncbi:MAG: septal ring lytic transglycosylase RlpA family protein [Acidimicrobiia bacterium]|nr:septal ring lytic transglycosylase RlpA family protein [Acidimicrobiia bacterium]
MRRHLLIAFSLLIAALGPAALGSTAVDRALDLAELRLERPALEALVESARADFEVHSAGFELSREELDAVLAEQIVALDQLEEVEGDLRAARSRFDDGIEQLYIRGGTAALTVVMFFDDPTEAGIATHYLEALNDSETDSLGDIEELLPVMDELKYTAFDAVELAEADYAERERAFLLAAGHLAELESELARLDVRVDRLTTEWREYRLGLVEDVLQATGATGVLAEVTAEQGALRASLPLGPTVGIPPGLESTGRVLSGVASWYGPGFHGRRASSGAIFDERDFTVAHKTLAHGTLLLVTFGDKQAVVMVNDRGPFIEGRSFDLSKAAAQYLGVGLNRIKAEVLVAAP